MYVSPHVSPGPQVNREVIGQLRRLLATYHHRNERPKIKHLKNLINHLKTLIVPLSSLSSLELRGLPDVNNKTVSSCLYCFLLGLSPTCEFSHIYRHIALD